MGVETVGRDTGHEVVPVSSRSRNSHGTGTPVETDTWTTRETVPIGKEVVDRPEDIG